MSAGADGRSQIQVVRDAPEHDGRLPRLDYAGSLIIVEGVDGSGKSTQLAMLCRWLQDNGADVLFTATELEELAILTASVNVGDVRELDAWLPGLPAATRPNVRLLAPLARLADAFNVSRLYTTRCIEVSITDDTCSLKIQSRNKAKPELRAIREHADLFSQVYGREIVAAAERQGPPPADADLGPAMPHSFCPIYR